MTIQVDTNMTISIYLNSKHDIIVLLIDEIMLASLFRNPFLLRYIIFKVD